MKYEIHLLCAAALRNHCENLSLQAKALAYSNHGSGSNEDMNRVLPNSREKFLALVQQTSIIFKMPCLMLSVWTVSGCLETIGLNLV